MQNIGEDRVRGWPAELRGGLRRAGEIVRRAAGSRLWLKGSPWLFATAFIAVFFWTNSRQYATFDLQAPDVPRFSQAIWNTLRGRFLYSSIIDDSILSFHFSPFLALLSPLLLLWSDVRILFLAQLLAVAATGLILQRLLQEERPRLAPWFLLAFYLNPALHEVALQELRRVIFAMPFIALALYGLHKRRYPLLALGLALALLCKEDVSIIVFMVGLHLLLFRREWKWGAPLMLAGLAWAIAVPFWVMPAISKIGEAGYPQLNYFSFWGDTPGEIVSNMARDPLALPRYMLDRAGLRALWRTFLPLGLVLPFLAPSVALIALPSLGLLLLSNMPTMHRLVDWYLAPLLPILFAAVALALLRLPRPRAAQATALLLGTGLLGFFLYSPAPFGGQYRPDAYRLTEHHRMAREVVQAIPPEAAVAAQDAYLAHLAHRRHLYRYPWISVEPEQLDYYVLDRQLNAYPLDREDVVHEIGNLVAQPQNVIAMEGDGIFLIEVNGQQAPSFAVERVAEEAIYLERVDVALADPGDFYRTVAREPLVVSPGQTIRVGVYWRALAAPGAERTVSVRLVDHSGALAAQHDMLPSNGARPTSWWEPGWYFRDLYYLDVAPTATPGPATLELLLYDSFTTAPIPFDDGAQSITLLNATIQP